MDTYTPKQWKALLDNVSDDGTRLHLCGIYVAPGAAWATDGHTAIVVGKATDAGVHVPVEVARNLLRVAGPKGWISVEHGVAVRACDSKGGALLAHDLRGPSVHTSPPIEQVLTIPPAAHAPTLHHINAELLERALALQVACDKHAQRGVPAGGVAITLGEQGDPWIVSATDDSDRPWRLAVMPMRVPDPERVAKCKEAEESLAAKRSKK